MTHFPLFNKTFLVLFALMVTISLARDAQSGKIPVTTSSDKAYELFIQGRDLQERLQFQESIKFFQQAVIEDTAFAMGYLYLAQVSPIATDFFSNLERAKIHMGNTTDGEKLWILGLDAGVNGFVLKQRDLYTKLVTMFPQDERAQNLLAAHYFGQQDYEKAIDHYLKAIEINPDFSTPYNQMGYAYRFLYNYPEAEKAFLKYIELIPDDPNPYDSYAELLMKMGKYDTSIEYYQKALVINPNFVASHVGIASDLNFKGEHVQARERLKKLFDLARNNGELRAAYFATTISYVDEGKMDAALLEMEKQYRIAEKTNDVASISGDLVTMGNIYLEMAKPNEAIKQFEKAISIVRQSTLSEAVKNNFERGYLYNLSRAAVYKNDIAAATTSADEFCKQVTLIQNPFQMRLCHELKGMIASSQQDFAQAIQEFQQANLQNPYILYRMALAYDGLRDHQQAKQYYQKAKNFNGLNNLNYVFVRNMLK